MKTKWIQTIIIFVEDNTNFLEKQYKKTFKALNRFYTLSFYNSFKVKNYNNWYANEIRLNEKIKLKDVVNTYVRKLAYGI